MARRERNSPSSLVVDQQLEDTMSVRSLEVDRILLRTRVGTGRDGDEVGPDVGVEHGELELDVRQPDGRPDVLVGFEGLEVDLVRLKKAERRVEVSLRRSEGKLRR